MRFDVDGIPLIIDKHTLDLTGDITIDANFWGVNITSRITPSHMSGGCSL
ncbi:MAG: hypothetical protein ACP5G0_02685 [Desulfomonilia bacterium]